MRLIRASYILFFIVSILCFVSIEIDPEFLGFFGLISFGILPCLVINFIYLFYFLFRFHLKYLVLSIILFSIGNKHIERTITLFNENKKGEIKVVNSNVRIFNVYKHLRKEGYESSINMIKWVKDNESDILILQEYYNENISSIWNTTNKISNKYPYHHLQVSLYNKIKAEFGQVIFSKYPIINKGIIPYENKTFNQAIFADIVKGNDTIRIYNIHLQSMKIEERKLFDDKNNEKQIKKKLKETSHKLLRGIQLRTNQINKIVNHIKSSPYPVILGADMNDTPYSYSYNEFKKILNNSFEEKGNGFGFTFNGKLFFLRIDNLFASTEFETNSFKVHREIPFSDHFPISATYTLKK